MLKTPVSLKRLTSKSLKVGDGEFNEISVGDNNVEHAKNSRKLSKSQKLAKSGKKLSKSGNLPNFDAKKNGPSFLTSKARTTFNYL